MTSDQLQHATTLISLLHPAPCAGSLIEITGLAPRARPVKRYFTDINIAAHVGIEWNDEGYSTFVNVNGRKEFSGFESSVSAVTALVMDLQPTRTGIDDVYRRLEQARIPPTITAVSGNGAHAYLLLAEACEPHVAKVQAERLCKVTGSDAVQNTNRIFRLAGTVNYKTPPTLCYLTGLRPKRRYTLAQVTAALDLMGAPMPKQKVGFAVPVNPPEDWFELRKRLGDGVRDLIETGEKNAFSERQLTRSEADWVIVCALVRAEATDEMIRWVFERTNAKLIKFHEAGAHYLNQTIRAARRSTAQAVPKSPGRATDSHRILTGSSSERNENRYAER